MLRRAVLRTSRASKVPREHSRKAKLSGNFTVPLYSRPHLLHFFGVLVVCGSHILRLLCNTLTGDEWGVIREETGTGTCPFAAWLIRVRVRVRKNKKF